jgi:hypothetical protein
MTATYAEWQAEHDQHPLWPHGGFVPGSPKRKSIQAREARAVLEALLAKEVASNGRTATR